MNRVHQEPPRKFVGFWDGIVNPIHGMKMTPDINPIYALLERSCTRYSKNVSYVDVGLVLTGLDLIFSEYAIHFEEFLSIDPFPIVHFYY